MRGLFGQLPMRAQFFVEFLPALFGEEDARALQFNSTAGTGNVVTEPVRPFDIEIDVIGTPNDECWSFQRFEAIFDSQRVLVVERGEKTLQVVKALFAAKEGT